MNDIRQSKVTLYKYSLVLYILFEEVTQRLWKMQTIHIIRFSLRTTSLCELCAKKNNVHIMLCNIDKLAYFLDSLAVIINDELEQGLF